MLIDTTSTTSAPSAPSTTSTTSAPASSVNYNYFMTDTVLDKTTSGNVATESELRNLVEWYAKDLRTFKTKTVKFAAAMVANTIARRNMAAFAVFYSTISSCGELGKKIANDAFAGLQTACQEDGKHELAGKSLAQKKVKTKDGTKFVEFSFKEGTKSSAWTSALEFAKEHKSEILTFRLPKEAKKPQAWLVLSMR